MNAIIPQQHVSLVNHTVGYVTPYSWESSFDFFSARQWVSKTQSLAFYLAVGYVGVIFALQSYMKNKTAYKLKNPLVVWNTVLAVLSTIAWVRMFPEFSLKMVSGLHDSVCQWNNTHNITTAYWVYILLLLKIVELGDTLFVVLRKQKLLFLHWYHHFSVLIGSWISFEAYEPVLLWFVTVNAFVHSIMYSYYALKAIGVKIPRQYSMMITTIQLLQMVMGIVANVYRVPYLLAGDKTNCAVSRITVQVGLTLYIPFLYLFAKFFYDTYLRSSSVKYVTSSILADRIKKHG